MSRTSICALINELKACTRNLVRVKEIHEALIQASLDSDVYLANTLISMYGKCGSMNDALLVFETMKQPTLVSWTALILGYAENGEASTALDVFSRLRNDVPARIFVAILKACTDLIEKEPEGIKNIDIGRVLHILSSRSGCDLDMYVQSTLVDMYAKSRNMEEAFKVFSSMKHPDVVPWTALILGYADNGKSVMSLELFSRMRQACAPDARTFVAALKASSELAAEDDEGNVSFRERGKQLHLLALRSGCDSDVYVKVTLIDMYSKSRRMEDAHSAFSTLRFPNAVCWNALMWGYADNGKGATALDLFSEMKRRGCAPNARTFVIVFKAIAMEVPEVKIHCGKVAHMLALRSQCGSHSQVESSLVDMYAKFGSMPEAQRVFDSIQRPDVVTCTALMLGYADNGEEGLCLELFTRMKAKGLKPDVVAYAAALKACGVLGALEFGEAVHDEICSRGFAIHGILANYLVDFYAKCGSLVKAKKLFDACSEKDLVIPWNALIAGYGRHGDTQTVFSLFERMCDTGVQPSEITLICVLRACNHAGLVDKGKHYFDTVFIKYGIHPGTEHYNSMIDLFGRANKLAEALALLRKMPLSPDTVTWMSVMGACRKWKNVEVGKLAFKSLTSLNEENAAAYTLMATIYRSRGMWNDRAAAAAQATGMKPDVLKSEQSWWTSAAGVVHTFARMASSYSAETDANSCSC